MVNGYFGKLFLSIFKEVREKFWRENETNLCIETEPVTDFVTGSIPFFAQLIVVAANLT
jgi:hypothetical protein